jgi:hypothetical protein
MNRLNLFTKLARITYNLCVASFIGITILSLPGSFLQPAAALVERPPGVSKTDTVYVTPPTGEKETDRANIQAAFDAVRTGGTILFSPGADILIQGNQIVGAEGLGILIQNASPNRIAENRITGIQRQPPFPGITWDGYEQQWEDANGSGIWVSSGSNGDEIVGNTFEEVASHAVFIEGDSNRVEMHDLEDKVRDMGSGNQIHSEKGKDTIRSADQCIEETMLPHIEELKIPGASLVIMKDGRIILEETYGLASLLVSLQINYTT